MKHMKTAEDSFEPFLFTSEKACTTSIDVLEQALETDRTQGLSDQAVRDRLERLGKNELEGEKKTSFILKLLDQFKDFLILVLVIAAVISAFLGETIDAIIILAVVIINAVLGAIQENQAEKAIDALKKMSAPLARVIRQGKTEEIEARELVPGDLVILQAGDVIPADMRLIESVNLRVNEAALTGESVPVEKDANQLFDQPPGIGDRTNLAYSGMAVTYGRALGFVVATANNTEIGKIADRLKGIDVEMTPLQLNLNRLGKILGVLCLVISAVIFGVGLLQGGEPLSLFMTAVSLAVAAIPEGLPAVVTIILALGMKRMAKENAIVKRLLAVETLGSVDTICSDKTGTLTENEMTVTRLYAGNRVFEVSGAGYKDVGEIAPKPNPPLMRLFEIAALCNDAVLSETEDGQVSVIGDPTEGAMLVAAKKASFSVDTWRNEHPLIWELPFDSERKMMSVASRLEDDLVYSFTKGAPDNILLRSSYEWTDEGAVLLSEARRSEILEQNRSWAKSALRVLGFAFKVHDSESIDAAEEELVFVGLMAMMDPPRPEAKEAIRVCHEAGISVVMITGDHQDTATAIADELQLRFADDSVLSGAEIEQMSDDELFERAAQTSVYARVSPEHKVRIVEALRRLGRTVSMTGDGVNDAPALKRADIGVAMGITGTDVAKGAADMVLADDNFGTIVSAVEEGRVIYSNIRKVVGFLLSCNMGEILVIFLTNMILGPAFTPLFPVQLLWLNLVTDSFPALALGRERAEEGIMLLPPRGREAKILDRPMIASILSQATAIFVTVFLAFNIGRYLYPDLTSTGLPVSSFSFMPQMGTVPSWGAHTFAFMTLILAEILRVFSARSEEHSVFSLGFFSNRTLNKAVLLSLALTLVVVYVPFLDQYFKTVPLSIRDWGIILALILIPFLSGELFKFLYHKMGKTGVVRTSR